MANQTQADVSAWESGSNIRLLNFNLEDFSPKSCPSFEGGQEGAQVMPPFCLHNFVWKDKLSEIAQGHPEIFRVRFKFRE